MGVTDATASGEVSDLKQGTPTKELKTQTINDTIKGNGIANINYSLEDAEKGFLIDERDIPYNERRQLQEYIMRKNHQNKKLKPVDCKEIGDNFYVWRNKSKTDYSILFSIPIVGNEADINYMRGGINEVNAGKEGLFRLSKTLDKRYGNSSGGGLNDENIRAGKGDVSLFERKSRSDRREDIGKGDRDSSESKVDDSDSLENDGHTEEASERTVTNSGRTISYSLEHESQSDVMWTLEEGVLNKREVAVFYQLFP